MKTWNPCRRSCEPRYISKIKSECGIAQLSLPLFVLFVLFSCYSILCPPCQTHLPQLPPRRYNIPTFDQSDLLILSRSVCRPVGRSAGRSVGLPEIEMFGGCSNDLKTLSSFVLSISKLPTGEGLKQHAQILF